MKLTSIILDGFRAFGSRQHFDLDADATVVFGPNGQGKTSLFDGILWALTGTIPRFSSEESVLSMWSQTGQAQVELGLVGLEGRFNVIRSFDGEQPALAVKTQDQLLRGPEAETQLLRLLWEGGLAAADPQKALCSALERGAYLQQDLVTQFIAADSPQERFGAISELVGSGRIRELQEALERARRAWSTATTTKTRERDEVAQRVAILRDRLTQLGEPPADTEELEKAWTQWWMAYRDLAPDAKPPPATGVDAAGALDQAIRELQGKVAAWERRRQEIQRTEALIAAVPARPTDDLEDLERRANAAEADLKTAQGTLAAAREQAASLRRQHVELQEQRASLSTFASLALAHLGDRCPVCGQAYDRSHTTEHLTALVERDGESSTEPPALDVSAQAAAVEASERRLAEAQAAVDASARRLSAWQAQTAQARAAAIAVGVEDESADFEEQLRNLAQGEAARIELAGHLRAQGERLALRLTRVAEAARRDEIQTELGEQEHALAEIDAGLAARRRTGDVATAIIEGLREASASVVKARLEDMRPLIQRFFATADPHPAFRNASLYSTFKGGSGRVTPSLSDPVTAKTTELPQEYLSSSQLNVFAVAVFLALNLGMPALPIRTAILDDPLQSLDDLNLLGLIDLFRRVREHRQLIVSTHEERFAQLLQRKLRPVADGQRTRVIIFESWRREGPEVRQFDLPHEQVPMRLVS